MSKDNAVTNGDKAIADALLGLGPAAEIKKPDWGYWTQLRTVRLNDAVLLSLDICPDWVDSKNGEIRVASALKTALENRKRIAANRAADILPMLAIVPEHARLARDVGLADFAAWAASTMKWADLPPELVAMGDKPTPVHQIVTLAVETPEPAKSMITSVVIHSTSARRNMLKPIIEKAQTTCNNPKDAAEVWAALLAMAEAKTAPLLGATEDGIQYLKNGSAAILNRDALRKRLAR